MGAERWDEQVGSVADEAGRLLESLRRTAAESAAESAAGGPTADDGPDAAGPGARLPARRGLPAHPRRRAPTASATTRSAPGARCAAGRPSSARSAPRPSPSSPTSPTLAATVLTDLASSRPGGGPPASDPDHPAGQDTAAPARPAHRPRHARATAAPSRPIPVSDADDPQEEPRG